MRQAPEPEAGEMTHCEGVLASMKINTVDESHGGRDLSSLGLNRLAADDWRKSASQRLQCFVLMLISGCIRRAYDDNAYQFHNS
jgi:hypothetical protein